MAFILALAAIFLWSTNAVVANHALKEMPVEQVQFLQFLGACFVILLIVWRRRPETKIQTSEWHVRWALGVIGLTGTMIFQYIAFDIGPIT